MAESRIIIDRKSLNYSSVKPETLSFSLTLLAVVVNRLQIIIFNRWCDEPFGQSPAPQLQCPLPLLFCYFNTPGHKNKTTPHKQTFPFNVCQESKLSEWSFSVTFPSFNLNLNKFLKSGIDVYWSVSAHWVWTWNGFVGFINCSPTVLCHSPVLMGNISFHDILVWSLDFPGTLSY